MQLSKKRFLTFAVVIVGVGVLLSNFKKKENSTALPSVVDYNFHIKPILSDRCFKCHGPDKAKQEADLGLHDEAGLYKSLKDDPARRVIVPGKPEQSELYLRIVSHDPDLMMPPPESNLSISNKEIALIKKWIAQGATYKRHWAFLPPEKMPLPKVKNNEWPQNEIDFFILQKIENEGLKPNPPADKSRLLRRASYDLTGLPPTPEMMDRFLADPAPDAFDKIVDELLDLPAFGEQQAAHWLDLARYADSHGYQDDSYRSMWPWRDWVIHAFNTNMPYDQFVTWQLAGDLLPEATKEQILATGFCRNHKITQEGGVIEEEYRTEYIADKTNVFGLAFLALTFECARCHDHKYDPLSQEEYFMTYAFFNQSNEKGYYGDVSNISIAEPPVLVPTQEELADILHFINATDADTVVSMVMQDETTPRQTFTLKRGHYDHPDKAVDFGTPAAVLDFPEGLPKNRLGLAAWTFDEKNPLTARVAVNRIWQQFFGNGIVKSSDNFGSQGDLPSHPELLDWLAVDFRENGWDVKRLMKKIATSATYRQSSGFSKQKLEADPENRLLARGPRHRLTPEMIRDTWLATSGLLHPIIGGPPLRPYQPEGLWEETNAGDGRGSLTRYVQDTAQHRLYRRTIYTIFKRTLPHPFLTTFDASYRDVCAVKRQSTNTPLQALNLMNDPTMRESARFLAENLLKNSALNEEEKIGTAFRRIACRQPSAKESALLSKFYKERKTALAERPNDAKKLVRTGNLPPDDTVNPLHSAALADVIALLFNMDGVLNKE